jgi:hypothetical protein
MVVSGASGCWQVTAEFVNAAINYSSPLIFNRLLPSHGCDDKITTQVVILRAAGSFAPRLARLKNATTAFFNGLIGQWVNRSGGKVLCCS